MLVRCLLLDYGGKITMQLNVTDCTYIRKDINFQFHDSLVVHYFFLPWPLPIKGSLFTRNYLEILSDLSYARAG